MKHLEDAVGRLSTSRRFVHINLAVMGNPGALFFRLNLRPSRPQPGPTIPPTSSVVPTAPHAWDGLFRLPIFFPNPVNFVPNRVQTYQRQPQFRRTSTDDSRAIARDRES
ncbi:MAG: hypothetical protein RLY70_2459 [Planctomycetota bacterium]